MYEHRQDVGTRPAGFNVPEVFSLIEPVEFFAVCYLSAQTLSLGPIPEHDRSDVDGSKDVAIETNNEKRRVGKMVKLDAKDSETERIRDRPEASTI